MRVSDGMLHDMAQRGIERAREKAASASATASSGLRVQKPSDDPVAHALARRETARESTARSSERTAEHGLSLTAGAEGALAGVTDALGRARELGVQLANGTFTAEDRAAAAYEVRELRHAIAGLANTEVEGVHVFAGYRDAAPPFDQVTGAYSGDGAVRKLEVAPYLRFPVGVSGATTFGAGTGTDVFATLDAMATALDTNDVAGVRASLDGLDASATQVLDARAELGSQMRGFEGARSAAQIAQDRGAATRAQLTEVDPYRAFLQLANAERALEASVAVAARLPFAGLLGAR